MLQRFLSAIVAEEWARKYTEKPKSETPRTPLLEISMAQEITNKTLTWLQGNPPPVYYEMAFALSRIHSDCSALLQMFSTDCKLPMSSIPSLGGEVDVSGTSTSRDSFTISKAHEAIGSMYTQLKDRLGRTRKKELLAMGEKRQAIVASIERYNEVKIQHDTRVSAAFASAFVAFKSAPDKVSPVVKGIMNGIKVCSCIFLKREHCINKSFPPPP